MSRSPHVSPLDMNRMFVPEGYVLLSDAIADVGKAFFPTDWDGLEFQCSQLVVEGDLICTPDQVSRRARVEHFFQDHAANKELKIFYRDDAGGMHLTPPEWWNVDNLTPRFTYCRIDPDKPLTGPYSPLINGTEAKRQRFTLFVDSAGLNAALASVAGMDDEIILPPTNADKRVPLPDNYTETLQGVADSLDQEGVSKRVVKKSDIVSRWPQNAGPVPIVENITSLMSGRKGGRPPERKLSGKNRR